MPRADLLALTDDDLISLTNRGTVKRAQKELEQRDPTCEIQDDDAGGLTVVWSDGVTCRFLASKTIHDAVCSSGGINISRHIIRSVLAYQRAQSTLPARSEDLGTSPQTSAGTPTPNTPNIWDPGEITDDQLVAAFKKPAVTRARNRFEQGVLVELTRGAKPTARFLDSACTVRFAVPGELGYATADCAEPLWSTWIPLAVWSFRELPAGQLAGLVSLQRAAPAVPTDLFADVQTLVGELCCDGLAGLSPSWRPRLLRAEQRLRDDGLAWLAELSLDIAQQFESYEQHDARFDPDQLVLLVGELSIRMRALTRGVTPVPHLLIRGAESDRPTDIDSGRYAGVGLGIQLSRRHTTLRAYLQETNTGNVVAVERTFVDPDGSSGEVPKSFDELGTTVIAGGASISALGMSQLLVLAGKRTPGGKLILPRLSRQVTVHPQSFQWEGLKAPFAVESVAQLRARLRFLPPSYLRPRRPTENLHGLAVADVQHIHFDPARQRLTATLVDVGGETALLSHPFLSRGAAGFSAFVECLAKHAASVRFVAGHVRAAGQGLTIHPSLVIIDDGSRRFGVNPWLATTRTVPESHGPASHPRIEAESFFGELQRSIGEALLTGLARDPAHARTMEDCAKEAGRLGFVRVAEILSLLADELADRRQMVHWDATRAALMLRHLCVIARVAVD